MKRILFNSNDAPLEDPQEEPQVEVVSVETPRVEAPQLEAPDYLNKVICGDALEVLKHPCEKPQPLLRHIIQASSRLGVLVLDCFAGSGSTLEAAKSLGRDYLGVEFSEHWCQKARERVEGTSA